MSESLNMLTPPPPLYFLKWYAVCLSDVGDYEGIKVKIGNSFIIKEHLEVS